MEVGEEKDMADLKRLNKTEVPGYFRFTHWVSDPLNYTFPRWREHFEKQCRKTMVVNRGNYASLYVEGEESRLSCDELTALGWHVRKLGETSEERG
jgi:hypothetical protein